MTKLAFFAASRSSFGLVHQNPRFKVGTKMTARAALFVVSLTLLSATLAAQTFPFPQNATYAYGIKPMGRNHGDAQEAYNDWKSRFVTSDGAGGYQRVFYDENPQEAHWTVSEGIGYGMLLAVNMAERSLFDNLWLYSRLHENANGLMKWKIRADGTPQAQDSATDADEDMAFALLCADKQWGSEGAINYLQEAITIIDNIYDHEVDQVTFALKPGDAWGSRSTANPSYLVPAYYRFFRNATQDDRWLSVAQKSYDILQAAAHPSTGLLPNWCLPNGGSDPQGPLNGYDYGYDATRTPWRIALDYLWFGIVEARTRTDKLTAFANSKGIINVKDGYLRDGTLTGSYHNSAFVGPFAAGSMAAPAFQSFCDAAYQENVRIRGDNYFNASLKVLTLLLLTGNFMNPCPTCGPAPINLLINPSFEQGTTGWSCNGCTHVREFGVVADGQESAFITGRAGSWAGSTQTITQQLTNGETYSVSGRVRTTRSEGSTARFTFYLNTTAGVQYVSGPQANVLPTQFTQISGEVPLQWSGTLLEARVYVETLGDSAPFYLDDVRLALHGTPPPPPPPPPAPNLLANPSFEQGTTGWTCNNCTHVREFGVVADGQESAFITGRAGSWAGPTQTITQHLTNGETYSVSGRVRTTRSQGSTARFTFYLNTTAGVQYVSAPQASIQSTQFTQISGEVTLHWSGTLLEARVYVETPGDNASFYLDNLVLAESP
jgi:endo-1,4-beta-D-glucanase Y